MKFVYDKRLWSLDLTILEFVYSKKKKNVLNTVTHEIRPQEVLASQDLMGQEQTNKRFEPTTINGESGQPWW